jgi:hypothetical protein
MSVELTFLVSMSQGCHVAHTMLPVGADSDLNGIIAELCEKVGRIAPKPVSCFVARDEDGEACYGSITEDKYGEKIKYLYADALKTLDIGKDRSDRQRAAFEYIKCLSDSLEIYLYWH